MILTKLYVMYVDKSQPFVTQIADQDKVVSLKYFS